MKLHYDSVIFNVKVGRGNFSNLDWLVGAVCGAPPPPCTACVCVVRQVIISSQVGQPAGVVYTQSSTEQSMGVGGGMMHYLSLVD